MSVIVNVMLSLMSGFFFCFRGELGFLDCVDICMYDVNKHIELLEFVFDYVYVDLQYNDISLTSKFYCRVCVLVWCL